jgi:hypothetical protein
MPISSTPLILVDNKNSATNKLKSKSSQLTFDPGYLNCNFDRGHTWFFTTSSEGWKINI